MQNQSRYTRTNLADYFLIENPLWSFAIRVQNFDLVALLDNQEFYRFEPFHVNVRLFPVAANRDFSGTFRGADTLD